MKKASALLLTICMVMGLLTGCTGRGPEVTESASVEDTTQAETTQGWTPAPITVSTEESTPRPTDLSDLPIDPPYNFNIDEMVPKDFGDFFAKSYPSDVSTYKLLPGDPFENEVTVIKGENPGPVIYMICGVHGNEEAAWQTGNLMEKISVKAGTLYILAPANKWGAYAAKQSRYVTGNQDLNRSFPGSPSGNTAQRIANAIYNDVKEKNPVFVFDLHEAMVIEENRDFLGSSLVYSDLTLFAYGDNKQDNLFFDIITASEFGEICSEPFKYYTPGPSGSVNRTISQGLSIPTMTIETFRGFQMEDRISDQLDIIQYVLRFYGMVD